MKTIRTSITYLAMIVGLAFVTTHAQAEWTVIKTNPAVKLIVDSNGKYYLAENVGVVSSTNKGQTWSTTAYNPPTRSGFNNVGGAAATPYGLFIGSLDQGIWRSTDAGESWNNTFGTGFGTGSRQILSYGNTLLATYGGILRGLYKWDPTSASWVFKYNPPASVDGNPGDFWDFTVDDQGSIYVTEYSPNHFGGVFKSTDQGETWKQVLSTQFQENPMAIEWWSGKLVAIRGTQNLGVVVSPDRGATWQSLPAVDGVSSDDFAMDMAVGSDGMLYACFSKAGVRRTADLSQGWTDHSKGLPAFESRNFTVADGSLFLATAGGLARLVNVPQVPRAATATAQMVNGFVVGATITDGGSGYTNAPSIQFVGGSGSGATGFASVTGGVVTKITITNPGIDYTVPPTIEIDLPPFPPTQAKGTASVENGFVTGIAVTDGGHGYSDTPPPVHLLRGGGAGAKAVATVANGVVTGISITNPGSGYTNAPTVLIAAPPGFPRLSIQVRSVQVTLEVIAGYNYKIQSTTDDGKTWHDTGESFLAEQATYTQIFEVIGTSQFFRVVRVP